MTSFLAGLTGKDEPAPVMTEMRIDHDNGLSELIAGELVVAATGKTFTEGPVWVSSASCLLFSDIPTSTAWRLDHGGGVPTVYRTNTGGTNGMTIDREGRVLCCEQTTRRVVRFPFDAPAEIEVLAEGYGGKRLNSPNDIVVHDNGDIYFTDPTYGLGPGGEGKEQRHNGVYRIRTSGEIELVDDRFLQPNGLVFAPDGETLYIDDTQQLVVRAFRVGEDGELTGGKVFLDLRTSGLLGAPDGMTVDADGRLWTTGPGGIWVADDAGTILGHIVMPEQPSNVTFGGEDATTLFITAETSVYAIATRVRGISGGR